MIKTKTFTLVAIATMVIAAILFLQGCSQKSTPMDGDIIFHESLSNQSQAIKQAQRCRWTHCGIVFHINGKPYVYEAVEPVKYTPLQEWIDRGKNQSCQVKRLKKGLSKEELRKMKEVGIRYRGKHYDALFQWSDERIYCSELVWKVYEKGAGIKLCEPKTFSELSLDSPEVQSLIQKRYKNALDMSELIVPPADIFNSSLLMDVRY